MAMQSDVPGTRERRHHKRFKIHEDALVFLGKDSGTILDISKGGLAVHLTVFEQELCSPRSLDIFSAQAHFYLPNIPVLLVNEVQTLPNSLFSTLRVKRLSMQFGPLSNEQQTLIDEFISRNSVVDS